MLFAGEAAGLQDALFGFGMRYALTSGHVAGRAWAEHDLPLYEAEALSSFEMVRRHVNARLQKLTPQMDWKADQSGLRLSYSPTDLLGTIWLQFAQAITQPKEFRHCKTCERPFEVSRDSVTGKKGR